MTAHLVSADNVAVHAVKHNGCVSLAHHAFSFLRSYVAHNVNLDLDFSAVGAKSCSLNHIMHSSADHPCPIVRTAHNAICGAIMCERI